MNWNGEIAYLARRADMDCEKSGSGVVGAESAAGRAMPAERRFVYVLRSEAKTSQTYVGISSDVAARLKWHNAGPSGHTLRHRPWRVAVSIEFPTEQQALRFERYLKSGSGRAFAKRHFEGGE